MTPRADYKDREKPHNTRHQTGSMSFIEWNKKLKKCRLVSTEPIKIAKKIRFVERVGKRALP